MPDDPDMPESAGAAAANDPDDSSRQETVPVVRFRDLQGANDRLRTELRGRDEVIATKDGEISKLQGHVGTLTSRVRDLLVASHPDAVAELIGGDTVEEVEASIPAAKDAFARAKEAARKELAGQVIAPGSPSRSEQAMSAADLPAVGKIAAGLRQSGS